MSLEAKEQSDPRHSSATETVIRTMEEFSNCEPQSVVIIHTDEAGSVIVNGNCGKCMALGMMETAKNIILRTNG